MTALVSIRNLTVHYRSDAGTVEALAGIDLDIGRGERLAVVGESGSGKSTLALALGGLLPADSEIGGRIGWPGLSRPPENGRDMGFVFQDPGTSLDPVMRIGAQLAEIGEAHLGLSWRQAKAHAVELLHRVDLPVPAEIARAYPHQLSGGQRQRVAIAAALAGGPALLIADEPTSALDSILAARIVALFSRLAIEDGMALLFISHDIALASGLADRIAVFRHGRLVEQGATAAVLEAPGDPYTRALLDATLGLPVSP